MLSDDRSPVRGQADVVVEGGDPDLFAPLWYCSVCSRRTGTLPKDHGLDGLYKHWTMRICGQAVIIRSGRKLLVPCLSWAPSRALTSIARVASKDWAGDADELPTEQRGSIWHRSGLDAASVLAASDVGLGTWGTCVVWGERRGGGGPRVERRPRSRLAEEVRESSASGV